MYAGKLVTTIIYSVLLAWGFSVGLRQIWQGFRVPKELVNPLFGNRWAIRLFALHIAVVSADLFVVGPLALAHRSTLLYWGGRVALFSSSLPLGAFFDRNSAAFGRFIGRWVIYRNFFEYTVHVVVATLALNWFRYYLLLWWLVAYRYLDVGPRRTLRRLYDTPEKQAARPWAQYLNWAVIFSIYVLACIAVWNRFILFAWVPTAANAPFHAGRWAIALIVGFNIGLGLLTWLMSRWYAESVGARLTPTSARADAPTQGGAHTRQRTPVDAEEPWPPASSDG